MSCGEIDVQKTRECERAVMITVADPELHRGSHRNRAHSFLAGDAYDAGVRPEDCVRLANSSLLGGLFAGALSVN